MNALMNQAQNQAIVAEEAIHAWIKKQLGDCVPLITAESWLAGIRQLKTSGHSSISNFPLADVMAVACMQDSSLALELEAQAAELHLPFRGFDKGACEQIGQWIVESAIRRAHSASVDAAESRCAAAMLRQDLDRQQQAFQALEAAVQECGMPPFTVALDLPLASGMLVLAGEDSSLDTHDNHAVARGHLIQRLPISARRIASVDLHCERLTDAPDTGDLKICVLDLAGNQLESSSPIPLSSLSFGWNRFHLSRGIDCSDRDAVLKVSLSGGGAIRLALGPCVPIDRFHPRMEQAGALADAPLAVKVLRGFAGVRTPSSHVRLSEGGMIRRRAGDMPRAHLHATDDPAMGFDPVQYWEKEDGFLVHPPNVGMTVGIIENVDVNNLSSVTAIVNNNHREGPVLSFAIGVVPSGGFFHAPDVLGPWLKLPPLAWGEVHAPLPEPFNGKVDLLLATLVAEGQGNHMAWGLFRGFMLHTLSA